MEKSAVRNKQGLISPAEGEETHHQRQPVKEKKKSIRWMFFALFAGCSYGLGNVVFGLNCSQHGLFGASYIGPSGLIVLVAYRLWTQARVKLETGTWVDKNNSNYYEPLTSRGEGAQPGRFKWENFLPLTAFWLTSVLALIVISIAFKLALMSSLNQGCIPVLFSLQHSWQTRTSAPHTGANTHQDPSATRRAQQRPIVLQ